MSDKILFHGSAEIIPAPEFGKGKPHNDYGQGFYCTESRALAQEWACTGMGSGYVNQYVIDTAGLNILNLSAPEYTILHWLALLLAHRTLQRSTPVAKHAMEYLNTFFLPDTSPFDAIIGWRADDSYFSFARAFVGNEISLSQLAYAMHLGKLGEQFVLKSPKAFSSLQFIDSEEVDPRIFYPLRKERDRTARAAFQAQLDREDIDGLFMRDILRERIMPSDDRLR